MMKILVLLLILAASVNCIFGLGHLLRYKYKYNYNYPGYSSYRTYNNKYSNLYLSSEYNFSPFGNYYGILPRCYGGSGSYYYTYSGLPTGWRDYRYNLFSGFTPSPNYLYIPQRYRDGRYEVKVNVYDNDQGISSPYYLIFDIRDNKYKTFVRSYSDGRFNYRLNDAFTTPSWSEVEELIDDGDTSELRLIVNRVSESSLTCSEKNDFFNGVLSRIRKFVDTIDDRVEDEEKELTELEADLRGYQRVLNEELGYVIVDSNKVRELRIIISNIETQIIIKKRQISRIETSTDDLKSSFSSLRTLVERSVLNCYNLNYTYDRDNDGEIFYLTPNEFRSYLSSRFTSTYPDYFFPYNQNRFTIRTTNIYDSLWTKSYGRSYSYGRDLYSNRFACGSLQNVRAYYGVISRIVSDSIYVRENSRDSRIYLSDCTNIRIASGRFIPRVGDRIIWRSSRDNRLYNYYASELLCI